MHPLQDFALTRFRQGRCEDATVRAVSRDRAHMLVIASLPREGRVMRQVRRAFTAAGGKPLSTSQIMPWVYPRLEHYKHWHRWSARRALLRYAVPIGRSDGRGLPVIWAPRP
jgi:hypothetical protein